MPAPRRPHLFTVVYDAGAAIELATAVKSEEERKASFNAVDKPRQLGERLAPPHMKPLQGAAGLCELRPRQGRSDWRPVYVRRVTSSSWWRSIGTTTSTRWSRAHSNERRNTRLDL